MNTIREALSMTADQWDTYNTLPISFMCGGELHNKCKGYRIANVPNAMFSGIRKVECECKCHFIDDNFDVWIQEEEAKFYNVEVCAHRHCGWATTLAGEDYWVCEDCGGEM